MKRTTQHHTMVVAAATSACLALTGCIGGLGGTGGGFDCTEQSSAFEETSSQQGLLQESVPTEGPFPMAMVLSTSAVNKMLASVLNQNLPSVSQDVGPITVTLQPELPTIEIAAVRDCPQCILSTLGFAVEVDTGILGVIGGSGAASLSLPVNLAPIDNSKTGLMAMMDQATFLDLSVEVAGLSTGDIAIVEQALEVLASDYVREEFGSVEVVQFDSFQLGDDDLFLAARGPVIFPDEGTLVVGLHSNLLLPQTATIEEQARLPEGSELGVQLHPELLLSTMQRLLGVGIIPREYDANGNVDGRGDHQVTLETMSSSNDSDKLKTSFRVWRTGGGLCGFADISSDMSLRVNGSFVELEADNFEVNGGEGIGELLSDAANTWIAGDFMNSLTENMALTVNYRELSQDSEEDLKPQANEVVLDGRGLSVFLNLAD